MSKGCPGKKHLTLKDEALQVAGSRMGTAESCMNVLLPAIRDVEDTISVAPRADFERLENLGTPLWRLYPCCSFTCRFLLYRHHRRTRSPASKQWEGLELVNDFRHLLYSIYYVYYIDRLSLFSPGLDREQDLNIAAKRVIGRRVG